jgi:hypothetical protein
MIHNGSPYLNEKWYRLPSTARIAQPSPIKCSLQASSFFLQAWGLNDLPLRASDEHILIVRVPRAQSGLIESSISPTSQKRGASLLFTARIERPPFYRGGSASKKSARCPVDSLSAPLLDSKILFQVIERPSFLLTGRL